MLILNAFCKNHFRIFFCHFLVLVSCVYELRGEEKRLMADHGIIDTRGIDWQHQEVVLEGEWRFYWQQFLTPKDVLNTRLDHLHYLNVPGSWEGGLLKGDTLPREGYATFVIELLIDPDIPLLALDIPNFKDSYRLWVDDELVAQNGTVGFYPESTFPAWVPLVVPVNIPKGKRKIQILVQVSSFHYRNSGFLKPISIGSYAALSNIRELEIGFTLFVAGGLVVLAMFLLGLFVLWKNDKSILAFALFSLVISYRFFNTGIYFFNFIVPSFPWEISTRLEFLSVYMGFALFVWFVRELFPKQMYHSLFVGYLSLCITFSFLTFVLPVKWFSAFTAIFNLVSLLGIPVLMYVFYRAYVDQEKGALSAIVAMLILLGTMVVELMFYFHVLQRVPFVTEFAILFFILTMSFVFSLRFSYAFRQIVHLKDIYKLHRQTILERNKILKERGDKIEQQRNNIELKKNQLQTSNRQLKQSLQTASDIQNAIFPREDLLERAFQDYFIFNKPLDVVSGDFYWVYNQPDKITLALADCTGHGVPGAFMTMIGNTLLDRIVKADGVTKPSLVLHQMHWELRKMFGEDNELIRRGMDLAMVTIEEKGEDQFKLVFSGAKLPLLVIPPALGKWTELKANRIMLGGYSSRNFSQEEIVVSKGTVLILSTDGLKDQNNKNRQSLGVYTIRQLLLSHVNGGLSEMKTALEGLLQEQLEGTNQRDDILVLGVKL